MGVPVLNPNPMTVEEFFAFTDTRPDEERWELIDGEPVLNATPSGLHQLVLANLAFLLGAWERQKPRAWRAMPGIGVRVSASDLPEPDYIIRPRDPPKGGYTSRECDDIVVAFEVLSPSTEDRDLRWKRNAYSSLPSLTHYVVIAQNLAEVVVYERSAGFVERRLHGAAAVLDMPVLALTLRLADLYRETGLEGV